MRAVDALQGETRLSFILAQAVKIELLLTEHVFI